MIQANVHYIHLWSKHIVCFLVKMLRISAEDHTENKFNGSRKDDQHNGTFVTVPVPQQGKFIQNAIYLNPFISVTFFHAVLFIVYNFIKYVKFMYTNVTFMYNVKSCTV